MITVQNTQSVVTAVLPLQQGTAQPAPWRCVARLAVNLEPGDVLRADGRYQVTSEHAFNTMASGTVIVADDPTAVPVAGQYLRRLVRPMAQNFNGKAEHHYNDTLPGTWTIPADFEARTVHVILCAYGAASPTYSDPGDAIECDYVDLTATVFREAA